VYSNGTESNLLAWSLQCALYKDEGARRLSDPTAGSLFGDAIQNDDLPSGTIYVLQSRSDHPSIAEHRELIHKIEVTGGSVEARVANAAKDPTVLFANVDIVRRYQLFNISRSKLDAMLPGAPLRVLSLQPRRCRDKVDCLMPAMADCVTTISLAG